MRSRRPRLTPPILLSRLNAAPIAVALPRIPRWKAESWGWIPELARVAVANGLSLADMLEMDQWEDSTMSVVRARGPLPPSPSAGDGPPSGGDFAVLYPGIWEMMTLPLMPETNAPREGSTLMVFFQEGMVKICLNDRDQDCSAWVSAPDVDGALYKLEAGLAKDTLEWRTKKPLGKKGR